MRLGRVQAESQSNPIDRLIADTNRTKEPSTILHYFCNERKASVYVVVAAGALLVGVQAKLVGVPLPSGDRALHAHRIANLEAIQQYLRAGIIFDYYRWLETPIVLYRRTGDGWSTTAGFLGKQLRFFFRPKRNCSRDPSHFTHQPPLPSKRNPKANDPCGAQPTPRRQTCHMAFQPLYFSLLARNCSCMLTYTRGKRGYFDSRFFSRAVCRQQTNRTRRVRGRAVARVNTVKGEYQGVPSAGPMPLCTRSRVTKSGAQLRLIRNVVALREPTSKKKKGRARTFSPRAQIDMLRLHRSICGFYRPAGSPRLPVSLSPYL